MIWDFDKRRAAKNLIETMSIDSPFLDIYPNEFESDEAFPKMTFVFSDLGVDPKALQKLLGLTVRFAGKDLKFTCIRGQAVFRETYDADGNPEIWAETLVEFE